IFFFDIDNCLYDISSGISDIMSKKIAQYGEFIGLPKDKVEQISYSYYREYGLAIRGFIKHHDIDPVHYDENVDQSLPLESLLKYDPNLRNMLLKIKMRRWAFTNANKIHAERVLRILGIEDLFEGVTYCDYTEPNFACKPELPAYEKAMKEARVNFPTLCFFADDSKKNLDAAKQLGWTTILVTGKNNPKQDGDHLAISSILELPEILPEIFD
ncbi:pyrimidine 5'-nucleotidase, partial [Neoconidiobolus thromboides FSU 785]